MISFCLRESEVWIFVFRAWRNVTLRKMPWITLLQSIKVTDSRQLKSDVLTNQSEISCFSQQISITQRKRISVFEINYCELFHKCKSDIVFLALVEYKYPYMIREYDYLFKIVIVGNSSVGKSSILRRFADDQFQESYLATIGVDFRFKSLPIDGNIVKLQIWDTAGQQRFRTITSAYYKGAHGIFAVYDITNESSFQDLDNFWFNEIEKFSEPNVQLCMLGNKSDSDLRKVETARLEEFAAKRKVSGYQVSAKNGDNIYQAFMNMARELIKLHPKVEKHEASNKVIENIKKKKSEFKLKSGADQVEKKDSKCC